MEKKLKKSVDIGKLIPAGIEVKNPLKKISRKKVKKKLGKFCNGQLGVGQSLFVKIEIHLRHCKLCGEIFLAEKKKLGK